VLINVTTYCPFQEGLSDAQRRIEGGKTDRKDRPLHTYEDHVADPVAHPYVSLAGDYTVWPYGTRLLLDDTLGVPSPEWTARTGETSYVARVVDTGGNFFGPGKVIRVPGYEPIDICVASCSTSKLPGGTGIQETSIYDNAVVSTVLSKLGGAPFSADYVIPILAVGGGLLLLSALEEDE